MGQKIPTSHYHHWLIITGWLARRGCGGIMENEAVPVLAVWVYGRCTVTVRRHQTCCSFFSGNKPLILQSLIFPPCGTVRALSLAPAPTTRPEAKSSSPWVVYLSISVTGICDRSFIKGAAEFPFFSTHTPFPSNYSIAWFGWISARARK